MPSGPPSSETEDEKCPAGPSGRTPALASALDSRAGTDNAPPRSPSDAPGYPDLLPGQDTFMTSSGSPENDAEESEDAVTPANSPTATPASTKLDTSHTASPSVPQPIAPSVPTAGVSKVQITVRARARGISPEVGLVATNDEPPHWTHLDKPPRRLVIPEKGSLFGIIIANPQLPLFVRPAGWSDNHARLLSIAWTELPGVPSVRLSPTTAQREDVEVQRHLAELFSPFTRARMPSCEALPNLFPRSNILARNATPGAELRLRFDSRVYRCAVRVESLWSWPHPRDADPDQSFMTESTLDAHLGSDPEEGRFAADDPAAGSPRVAPHHGKPMLAYVGKKWLRFLRPREPRATADNDPVERLCALQGLRVAPADPERDPRFAAVLVAMAQEHVYPAVPPPPPAFSGTVPPRLDAAPDFRDVTVRLLTHGPDGGFLVCKATVSADYLRRFHYPLKTFSPGGGDGDGNGDGDGDRPPRLEIEVTKVPESPVVGLRQRLGAALGEDLVGPVFGGDTMWGLGGGGRDEERFTPDTEGWSPQPGGGGDVATDGDGVGSDGAADAGGRPDGGRSRSGEQLPPPEDESGGWGGGDGGQSSPVEASPVKEKRRREAEVPNFERTLETDAVGRVGKRRRASGTRRSPWLRTLPEYIAWRTTDRA